ncbi:amidase family protein [Pannonibacter sp. Pt2-lr]
MRRNDARARKLAEASDAVRAAGHVRSPLEGLPISVKDLFGIAGEVSLAGSIALKDAEAETADCPVVARLVAAGAVITGTTNMSEFAFSGLGINPHYGTPRNAYDRAAGASPAARLPVLRCPSPMAWLWQPSARTRAAPSAFPQRFAG